MFRNGYLVKVKDKNGNTLVVAWNEGRVISVTDGAGRKTVLTYLKNSQGKLTYLHEITSPSGKKKLFGYNNGDLVKIIDIDNETVNYTYDKNHMLTSLTDVDGYRVNYEYYTSSPYRVRRITEFGGNVKGNSLTLTYGYNSTKFTDNKKRSEIYRFNNSGNLLHIHDGFGHAASARFNTSGNHVNCLENATKLQTNVVQLLKDPIIQAAKVTNKRVLFRLSGRNWSGRAQKSIEFTLDDVVGMEIRNGSRLSFVAMLLNLVIVAIFYYFGLFIADSSPSLELVLGLLISGSFLLLLRKHYYAKAIALASLPCREPLIWQGTALVP